MGHDNIRQGGILNRNTVVQTHNVAGGGAAPYLAILAAGGAIGLALFCWVVATLIGAAVALAVIVLGSAAAAALITRAVTRSVLEVHHYRKTGELPQRQPLVQLGGKRQPAAPAIDVAPVAAIEARSTWADVYEAQGRDRHTAQYEPATYYEPVERRREGQGLVEP
jgi:hypothetical protein